MQDNSKRGLRTIFWLKASIVVTAVMGVLAFFVAKFNYEQFQGAADVTAVPGFTNFIVLLLFSVLVALVWSIAASMGSVYWALWIFRSEENLRKFTRTGFSPWGAVFCTLFLTFVPVVGAILDYLIFKDLLDSHEKVLSAKGVEFAPVPRRLLKTVLVMYLLCTISWFLPSLGGSVFILSTAVGIACVVFVIKLVGGVMAYEKQLFEFDQEEVLRKKVDEVLREREIEKAAAAIQAATYDVENATDGQVPSPGTPN